MGFFDKFRKKTVVDPEAVRRNFISARQQNLSYLQRNRVDPASIATLFTDSPKITVEKVGDLEMA